MTPEEQERMATLERSLQQLPKLQQDLRDLSLLFSNHRHKEFDQSKFLDDLTLDSIVLNKALSLLKVTISGVEQTILTAQNLATYVPGANTLSAYAAGTAYSLTATPALIDFGTTDPAFTISPGGTYLLFARVHVKYNGATFAANRTLTIKIRRTGGTAGAADITNSPATFVTQVVTTLTGTAQVMSLPVIVYAASSGDVLQLWGSIDVVPSAGSMDIVEAELVAIRIV